MGKETFTSAWYNSPDELIQAHRLDPLDVISFKRTGLITYRHYAVVLSPVTIGNVIKDHNCIHVSDVDGLTSGMKRVRIQKLTEIANDSSVFGQALVVDTSTGGKKPSQVRIHNLRERRDEGSIERIEEALSLNGQEIKYELLWANCEHFSNKLRSDLRLSEQVLEGVVAVFSFALLSFIVCLLFVRGNRNRRN